jgi:hypothetical protein
MNMYSLHHRRSCPSRLSVFLALMLASTLTLAQNQQPAQMQMRDQQPAQVPSDWPKLA